MGEAGVKQEACGLKLQFVNFNISKTKHKIELRYKVYSHAAYVYFLNSIIPTWGHKGWGYIQERAVGRQAPLRG